MPPRAIALPLIALLVVTAGCTGQGTTSADVTAENTESADLQMTLYMIEEPIGAGEIGYRVTDETGVRKTVDGPTLEDEGPYYNHSLAVEYDATERRLSIPAGENTTASFEEWEPDTALVFVFEAPDGRVVHSLFSECTRGSIEHEFTFSDTPDVGYEWECTERS